MQPPYTRLLLTAALLTGGLGCKVASTSGLKDLAPDSGAPSRAPFKPEDLAVLFPIERALFSRSFASDDQLQAELGSRLVPLAKLLSDASYRQLLAEATRDSPDEENPMAAEPFRTVAGQLPLAGWFVTGAHFLPCGTPPTLPLPQAVLEAPLPGGRRLEDWLCRPLVRLSVQRFGRVTCAGCGQRGTADDKALHLVYAWVGAAPDDAVQQIAGADAALLGLLQGASAPTRDAVAAAVQQAYGAAPVAAALAGVRRAFVEKLLTLRDAGTSGPLQLSYGAKAALPRYRHFIAAELATQALPLLVTQLFVMTGPEPQFDEKWAFAQYRPAAARGAFADPSGAGFKRQPTGFAYLAPSGTVQAQSAGDVEVFLDSPGNVTAVDDELLLGLDGLAPADAAALTQEMGMQLYVSVKDGGDRIVSIDPHAFGSAPFRQTLQAGYDAVNDVTKHNASGPSCVGCHVSTPVRQEFGLRAVPGAIGHDQGLNLDNVSLQLVGPHAPLNQVEFRQTWLIRALGYFGQSPCIADRTVAEVDKDVRVGNALLASFASE